MNLPVIVLHRPENNLFTLIRIPFEHENPNFLGNIMIFCGFLGFASTRAHKSSGIPIDNPV